MTPKQEHFCRLYVETGNASEAYRQAYNAENMKPESVNVEASRLLGSPNIALMIDELKAGHAARHDVTMDSLLVELEEARQAALNAPNPQSGAAVSASMGKAKLLGLLVEKAEITDTTPKPLEPPIEINTQETKAIIELHRQKGQEASISDITAIVGNDAEKINFAMIAICAFDKI